MAVLDFAKPHVLRNEEEYQLAVNEINELLDADVQTPSEEFDRLEFLSVLVEAYENEHYPFEGATPHEVIDFMLEQKGRTRGDLAEMMGGRSRVSDFFNGKRPLSLKQIRRLSSELDIPAELLLQAAGD